MKVAVIGSGISGLSSAYYLDKKHDVTLFETNDYLGGHTDTHRLNVDGESVNVDSGFIVFNYQNYPHFTRFINELGVESQESDMSFSMKNAFTGLEYNATNLDALFCQRKNILNPNFYRMLKDLVRFYKESPAILEDDSNRQSLGEYLEEHKYSKAFIDDHIIPMACALWSGPKTSIVNFPVRYFVSFMNNHKMLNLKERPQWRVVKGGSRSYVDAVIEQSDIEFKLQSPVSRVTRHQDHVEIEANGKVHCFDYVFMATHSDISLSMLADASESEAQILGGIAYQENTMCLHTDTSILPKRQKAWASWNTRVDHTSDNECAVSYYMNLLQNIDSKHHFIVSLNSDDLLDPEKVLVKRNYAHPIYTESTMASQQRWEEIAGQNRTYYCGAYWGWGFHEDGISSALRSLNHFDASLIPSTENLNRAWKNVA